MQATIEATIVCTIDDGFHLMALARQTVEAIKAPEEWDLYYPSSPTEALQLIIRHAIADRLLTCGGVSLHQISHKVKELDIPLEQGLS